MLGFHRLGDVPGFEIPARYFHFLRTGDPSVVAGVLEHNRHDLVSLAAVMSHALWLAQEGPTRAARRREQVGLGPALRARGRRRSRARAYELRDVSDERGRAVRRRWRGWPCCSSRRRVTTRRRRPGRACWICVAADATRRRRSARRAAEALAIHHEHRARDLSGGEALRRVARRATPPAGSGRTSPTGSIGSIASSNGRRIARRSA